MVPTLSKKGAASFVQSASTDPFTIEWYMKMTDNADVNKDLEARFTLKDPRFHETPTLIDFAVVFETFYKEHRVCVINYNNEIIYYTHDFFHSLHSRLEIYPGRISKLIKCIRSTPNSAHIAVVGGLTEQVWTL